MPQFGNKSLSILMTCDLDIQNVMRRAIVHGPDFAVISGRRTTAEQAEKVRLGYSKTMNSKHVADPPHLAKAIDIAPYIAKYKQVIVGTDAQVAELAKLHGINKQAVLARIWKQYGLCAGWILKTAQEYGVQLRWGGDWDMDWNSIDNDFEDLGHFELIT